MTESKKIHISNERISSRQTKQLLIEMNYIMPDNKPRINSVVDTFVKPSVSAITLNGDSLDYNLSAECTLVYNALEVSEEEEHLFSTACDFSKMFKESFELKELPEEIAENRMFSVNIRTDHVETTIISDRKAVVKAYVTAELLLKEIFGTDVISEFASDGIISKTKTVDTLRSLGIVRTQFFIKEDVELGNDMPAVDSIIAKTAFVQIDSSKIQDGKAVFYGTAHIDIAYENMDNEEHFAAKGFDLDFNQACEIPDVSENATLRISADMSEISIDAKENNILSIEGVISFDVETYDYFSYNVVDDAFIPDKALILEKREEAGNDTFFTSNQIGVCAEKQSVANNDVAKVLLSEVKAKECNAFVNGKNIVFEGIYSIKTLYVAGSDPNTVKTVISEIPFSYGFESRSSGEVINSGIDVKSVTAQVNDYGEINVKWMAAAEALVTEQNLNSYIVSAEEKELEKPKERAIYYHFTADGETLWDVAKKYGIAPDEIRRLNPTEDAAEASKRPGLIVMVK